MDPSAFPSIDVGFRFHPARPVFTLSEPTPSLATPSVDPNPQTPLSDATSVGYPSSEVTDAPFAWITSLIPRPSESPHLTPSPHHAPPSHVQTTSLNPTIPDATRPAQTMQQSATTAGKGAQIGIIVGITVVVILSLFAVGMAIMDYRRRFKRRRAEKANKDSELNIWEEEMRTGRSGQKRDRGRGRDREGNGDGKVGGLWAGLKVGEIGQDGSGIAKDGNGKLDKERMGSKGALWERVGGKKLEGRSVRQEDLNRERHAREPEWSHAYMSTDRRSVVSEGSMGVSVMGKPVAVMSFLGKERT